MSIRAGRRRRLSRLLALNYTPALARSRSLLRRAGGSTGRSARQRRDNQCEQQHDQTEEQQMKAALTAHIAELFHSAEELPAAGTRASLDRSSLRRRRPRPPPHAPYRAIRGLRSGASPRRRPAGRQFRAPAASASSAMAISVACTAHAPCHYLCPTEPGKRLTPPDSRATAGSACDAEQHASQARGAVLLLATIERTFYCGCIVPARTGITPAVADADRETPRRGESAQEASQ